MTFLGWDSVLERFRDKFFLLQLLAGEGTDIISMLTVDFSSSCIGQWVGQSATFEFVMLVDEISAACFGTSFDNSSFVVSGWFIFCSWALKGVSVITRDHLVMIFFLHELRNILAVTFSVPDRLINRFTDKSSVRSLMEGWVKDK